jgi:TetR/AcrR family transcriptional repressor of nem operon
MKARYGRVLGCPLFALGSEVCTQEDRLGRKVQAMLADKCKYLESAIRDAHASGVIHAPDAGAKARMILAYFEGVLTQARIQNDVKVLRATARGVFTMLGAKAKAAAAA